IAVMHFGKIVEIGPADDIYQYPLHDILSLYCRKVWDDKDNQDGKRPEKVSVNLLANGEKVETVDVTSETNWK
ncbi:Cna B-type domain-containing protein, partial [Staphylococcus aureus]